MYLRQNRQKNVQIQDVVGVSMWFPKGNGVREHRLYRSNNDSEFALDLTYSLDCGAISRTEINYLTTIVLNTQNEVTWVGYSLDKGNSARFAASDKPLIPEFSRTVINNANVILVSRTLSGSFACGNQEGFDCQFDDRNNFVCTRLFGDPGNCPKEKLDELNKNSRLSADFDFDIEIASSIRDNILTKSSKGKEYINHYYKISKVENAFSVLNIGNALENMDLAVNLVSLTSGLEKGKDDEILIDKELKQKALLMIKEYKKISMNKEYQRILKTIENDVNELALKKKSEVKRYISIE